MDKRERLIKKIKAVLTPEENILFNSITVEARKDNNFVFHMPKGVMSVEDIWTKIEAVCKESAFKCIKAGQYATVSDFNQVLGDVEWIWKNWIPKGFNSMIVGDPGVGKSAVVLSLVDFLISGRAWPTSDIKAKKGSVLWIDTENSQQLLMIRSNKMKVNTDKIYVPIIDGDMLGQVDVMNEEHMEVVVNMVDELKPELVVVDSLGGSHTRGENKTEDIAPIMKMFAGLSQDKKIGVLFTHHLNKGIGGEDPEISLYRIRGSTAIPQYTRSILALEKAKDNELKLRVLKSNVARIGDPLSLEIESDDDGDITKINYGIYKAPPKKMSKQEHAAIWLTNKLKNSPEGIRVKDLLEIAEPEGYTKQNLYSARMLLKDQVISTGTGRESYWKPNTNERDHEAVDQIVRSKKGKKNANEKR